MQLTILRGKRLYLTPLFFIISITSILLMGCATLKGKSYFTLGETCFFDKDYTRAIQYFKKALEIDKEKSTYLSMLGWSYFKSGDYDQAIATFSKLEELDKNFLDAYTGRGWSNFKKSNFDEAITYFVRAAKVAPDLSEPYAGLGWCNFRKGDIQVAEDYFKIALSKGMKYIRGSPVKTEPEAHRGLGYLYFSKGDFKTSLKHFKTATRLMPNENDVRLKWAESLFSLGKYKEAVGVYRHALKYAKSIETYDKIGWCYYYTGQKSADQNTKSCYYKAARAAFNKGLEIDPTYASSLSGLSEIEKQTSSN